jgi:integrase
MKSSRVFFNEEGEAHDASNLRRAFNIALKKARIQKCRFHDLRHTFATRLVQSGVDLYKVQKLLRHKSPIMTQRYAHHYPESLRDGVETLDKNYHIFITEQKKGAAFVDATP